MILYLETNFLIGVATGREENADAILRIPEAELRRALPCVCVMEALKVFEAQKKERNRFGQELKGQVAQLRRDRTSAHASGLLVNLEQAFLGNSGLLNDLKARLDDVLSKIAGGQASFPAVELIPLEQTAFRSSLGALASDDAADELILNTILHHASGVTEPKAFLSGNTRHFDVPAVRDRLRQAVVDYFSGTDTFLGWFNARRPAP